MREFVGNLGVRLDRDAGGLQRGGGFGVQTALRLKSKKLKATGIYPEKQKTQEFIGKNNNLSTVIPTKVGILIRPHGNLYFVICTRHNS
ncbi:hypothetical protein LN384_24090, partial [Enterobacter hormaechei subsp. steigerwaltii]|nr:hypothetical protein [Enterobacter hormaechei subsp. steigerwaltii]